MNEEQRAVLRFGSQSDLRAQRGAVHAARLVTKHDQSGVRLTYGGKTRVEIIGFDHTKVTVLKMTAYECVRRVIGERNHDR